MNPYTQLQYIVELIQKINWPDDSCLYFTFGCKLNTGDNYKCISIYISPKDDEGKTHKEKKFGEYFSFVSGDLSDAIINLEAQLKVRGELI